MSDSLRPVNVGACRCPGTPHTDGDVVWLAEELSTTAGLAAQTALLTATAAEDRFAGVVMALLRHQTRKWTFHNDNGPIPVTPETVGEHLGWLKGGKEVAGEAAAMFTNTIYAPFREASEATRKRRAKKTSSSRNGSTATPST